jgi:hypothetical protein
MPKQLSGVDLQNLFEEIVGLSESELMKNHSGKYKSTHTHALFEAFLLGIVCANEGVLHLGNLK